MVTDIAKMTGRVVCQQTSNDGQTVVRWLYKLPAQLTLRNEKMTDGLMCQQTLIGDRTDLGT